MRCYNMLCIFNQRNTCQKAEIQIGEFGECMQKVPLGNEERETLLMVRREMNRYPKGQETAIDQADLEDWQAELLEEWRERNLY
ncbi:hypothetical protein [Allofournierella sp.]|uniref:hypothetical protein n=1 Tax=Allofournierella sp. TaxID=1940256 RepID=UPI003AEFEB63